MTAIHPVAVVRGDGEHVVTLFDQPLPVRQTATLAVELFANVVVDLDRVEVRLKSLDRVARPVRMRPHDKRPLLAGGGEPRGVVRLALDRLPHVDAHRVNALAEADGHIQFDAVEN